MNFTWEINEQVAMAVTAALNEMKLDAKDSELRRAILISLKDAYEKSKVKDGDKPV